MSQDYAEIEKSARLLTPEERKTQLTGEEFERELNSASEATGWVAVVKGLIRLTDDERAWVLAELEKADAEYEAR